MTSEPQSEPPEYEPGLYVETEQLARIPVHICNPIRVWESGNATAVVTDDAWPCGSEQALPLTRLVPLPDREAAGRYAYEAEKYHYDPPWESLFGGRRDYWLLKGDRLRAFLTSGPS